jgi:hypothetical protein
LWAGHFGSGLFLFMFIQLNRWTNVQMGPRAPISMLAEDVISLFPTTSRI